MKSGKRGKNRGLSHNRSSHGCREWCSRGRIVPSRPRSAHAPRAAQIRAQPPRRSPRPPHSPASPGRPTMYQKASVLSRRLGGAPRIVGSRSSAAHVTRAVVAPNYKDDLDFDEDDDAYMARWRRQRRQSGTCATSTAARRPWWPSRIRSPRPRAPCENRRSPLNLNGMFVSETTGFTEGDRVRVSREPRPRTPPFFFLGFFLKEYLSRRGE